MGLFDIFHKKNILKKVEEKKATELTLALAGKEQEIARLQSAINENDSKEEACHQKS